MLPRRTPPPPTKKYTHPPPTQPPPATVNGTSNDPPEMASKKPVEAVVTTPDRFDAKFWTPAMVATRPASGATSAASAHMLEAAKARLAYATENRRRVR